MRKHKFKKKKEKGDNSPLENNPKRQKKRWKTMHAREQRN